MWHWDQGRLGYFEFDNLRRMSAFIIAHDFKNSDFATVTAATGLPFLPPHYVPWRNYARIYKQCLLISEDSGTGKPSSLAKLLAEPGAIISDEYFQFLVQASTEPSPAFTNYASGSSFRYPLLFALKYVLAKLRIGAGNSSTFNEIIEAFQKTNMKGDENDIAFIAAIKAGYDGSGVTGDARQPRESLLVIAQISYLNSKGNELIVSLDPKDADSIFNNLFPFLGPYKNDPNEEIQRRASLFGSAYFVTEYPNTIQSDVVESGFIEGSKVRKTHITIERNSQLRIEYFNTFPTAICDVCKLITDKTYPWTTRVLDLHHLLPLSSGTRVDKNKGTVLDDLVAVCPSCHRAIHRCYDSWLKLKARKDFVDATEALSAYNALKTGFGGIIHA
jgi:hypothetical protein